MSMRHIGHSCETTACNMLHPISCCNSICGSAIKNGSTNGIHALLVNSHLIYGQLIAAIRDEQRTSDMVLLEVAE